MTLNCFKDLASLRDPGLISQKFCILICNSPPYTVPVLDVPNFQGVHLEQLALLVKENSIQLSIISPRRIPTWVSFLKQCKDYSHFQSLADAFFDYRRTCLTKLEVTLLWPT